MGLVGLAEDRVEVDLGHVGPGQAKYLETARVAPGVGRGHSGTGPSPCGSTVALLRESAPWSRGELGVPLRVTWWVPSESGAARGGRGEGRARRPRGRRVPVRVRVRESHSDPGERPAGMGVPHRVEGQEAPGPAPGPWVTPQLRLVVT